MVVEPTWKRIGLTDKLSEDSGKGIGIIILDGALSHVSLSHLKGRAKLIKVRKDMTISCTDLFEEPLTEEVEKEEHGLMVLSLLAHQPMEYRGMEYAGLAPSANYIFLSSYIPERRKKGLEWILQQDWGFPLKICLNLLVPQERGWMSPTHLDPYVQALQPAVDAGLLVIAAGGNSRAHNNLHPKQYFTVSGYNDKGFSELNNYEVHPAVASGVNSDGHWRPDILAPYTYLPLPSLERDGVDYFSATCGSASLITGLCAYLFSIFPDLTVNNIRNALMETGDVLEGFPAPIVNARKAFKALKEGNRNDKHLSLEPTVVVTNEKESILSADPLERSLALTMLIKDRQLSREEIWDYTNDESPMVKKVAIQGLGNPINQVERDLYWERVWGESSRDGVKESWAYTLLETSPIEELDKWMSLVETRSFDTRICITIFLQKYFPDAPEIEHSPDPDPKTMSAIVAPLVEWHKHRFES
ncbi:S8 family serine peptidase [Risungbinella massiliensis]|uniref:S8 family serine peptidase n=1 Tax=Risungbinella massiliensis TaxID=1329796 RepID=UPI0005CB957B|nr:S8 family serine peptidase [Risungbinella massiliensis]